MAAAFVRDLVGGPEGPDLAADPGLVGDLAVDFVVDFAVDLEAGLALTVPYDDTAAAGGAEGKTVRHTGCKPLRAVLLRHVRFRSMLVPFRFQSHSRFLPEGQGALMMRTILALVVLVATATVMSGCRAEGEVDTQSSIFAPQ